MKTIEELLKNLARPEVLEFGLVTNRLPSVNIGGKFEPVDDEAPSTERLMQMLVTMGGSRYVDSLSDKPVQWTTRLDGVGVIAVAAIMRKEIVQARFTVAKREGRSEVKSTQQSAGNKQSTDKAVGPAPIPPPGQATGTTPNPGAATAGGTPQRPAAQLGRTQESRGNAPVPAPTPSPQPTATKAQPASGAQAQAQQVQQAQPTSTQARAANPLITNASSTAASSASMAAVKQTAQIQPQVIKNIVAGVGGSPSQPQQQVGPVGRPVTGAGSSSPMVAAQSATPAPSATISAAPAAPAPPDDEWDDDDEPTLQTLSPPVSSPPATTAEPRAKPARRPEEVSRPDLEEANTAAVRAAQEARTAAEARAAQERAAQERAAQERATAEAARAAQERAAQERAAQERAAAEARVAQERAAAEQRAEQERVEQERAAQERAAQERAAQERAAQERAAQERAAQERAAQERAAQERAAQERAAQERAHKAAQEQRASQERVRAAQAAQAAAAQQAAKPSPLGRSERRINTPTSVDAVDVEITTNDHGSGKKQPVAIDIDLEADNTLATKAAAGSPSSSSTQAAAKPAATSVPGQQAAAAQRPSTGQTAAAAAAAGGATPAVSTNTANLAEKDRPRVESTAALDSFLAMAIAARASDLHIVAGRPILLRVATDLLPRTQAVPAEHVERIAKEIVPSRLREQLERDGACDFAVEHTTHGRFRVNVSRQRSGYKINLRVVVRDVGSLSQLGLPEAVAHGLRHQRGLILVTGPASHGKSTTLAALIDQLNRETARHIVTIEEPIEHVHPRKKGLVSQREVGLHARSKTRAIQAALREDTDAIVISELRDRDSIRHALLACESGRLVLGTMNMPSAAKTIDRIRDLFPPSEESWVRSSLASSLRLIIGQRLVPSSDRTRLHVAVELLPWSVALYGIIKEGRTHQISTLQQRGKPLGILRLDESLAELVRAQKVTIEVAKQFAESPADLEAQAAPRNTSTQTAARK